MRFLRSIAGILAAVMFMLTAVSGLCYASDVNGIEESTESDVQNSDDSDISNPDNDSITLPAPKNVRLDDDGETIFWDAVEGAESYSLDVSNTATDMKGNKYTFRYGEWAGSETYCGDEWKYCVMPESEMEHKIYVTARVQNDEGLPPLISDDSEPLTVLYTPSFDDKIETPDEIEWDSDNLELTWNGNPNDARYWVNTYIDGKCFMYGETGYTSPHTLGGSIMKPVPFETYAVELFVVDKNKNYNKKTYYVECGVIPDNKIQPPKINLNFDEISVTYAYEDLFVVPWIRIKDRNGITVSLELCFEQTHSVAEYLTDDNYTVDACCLVYSPDTRSYRISNWSSPLELTKKDEPVESDTSEPSESDTSEPTSSDTSEPTESGTSDDTSNDDASNDTNDDTSSDTSVPTSKPDTSDTTSSVPSEPTSSEPTSSDTSDDTSGDTSGDTSSDTSSDISGDTSDVTSSDTSDDTSSDTSNSDDISKPDDTSNPDTSKPNTSDPTTSEPVTSIPTESDTSDPTSSDTSDDTSSDTSDDTSNDTSDAASTSTGDGESTKDVQIGAGAPNTGIVTPMGALLDAVLTAEELEQYKNGADIKITITSDNISSSVAFEDVRAVKNTLFDFWGYNVGMYVDMRIFKSVSGKTSAVHNLTNPITVRIEIPENLKKTGREFIVVRVHDGKATVLNDYDENDNTITFRTDKFSTYAIAYKDKWESTGSASADPSDNPYTGGNSKQTRFFVIGCVSLFVFIMLCLFTGKNGMTEEQKERKFAKLIAWGKNGGKIRAAVALIAIFLLVSFYYGIGMKNSEN